MSQNNTDKPLPPLLPKPATFTNRTSTPPPTRPPKPAFPEGGNSPSIPPRPTSFNSQQKPDIPPKQTLTGETTQIQSSTPPIPKKPPIFRSPSVERSLNLRPPTKPLPSSPKPTLSSSNSSPDNLSDANSTPPLIARNYSDADASYATQSIIHDTPSPLSCSSSLVDSHSPTLNEYDDDEQRETEADNKQSSSPANPPIPPRPSNISSLISKLDQKLKHPPSFSHPQSENSYHHTDDEQFTSDNFYEQTLPSSLTLSQSALPTTDAHDDVHMRSNQASHSQSADKLSKKKKVTMSKRLRPFQKKEDKKDLSKVFDFNNNNNNDSKKADSNLSSSSSSIPSPSSSVSLTVSSSSLNNSSFNNNDKKAEDKGIDMFIEIQANLVIEIFRRELQGFSQLWDNESVQTQDNIVNHLVSHLSKKKISNITLPPPSPSSPSVANSNLSNKFEVSKSFSSGSVPSHHQHATRTSSHQSSSSDHSFSDYEDENHHNRTAENSDEVIIVGASKKTVISHADFAVLEAELILDIINLIKANKEYIDMSYDVVNGSKVIADITEKTKSCQSLMRVVVYKTCWSLRETEGGKKIFSYFDSCRNTPLEDTPMIDTLRNERHSVLTIIFNKQASNLKRKTELLRSTLKTFVSIIWDPKRSESPQLNERNILLLINYAQYALDLLLVILDLLSTIVFITNRLASDDCNLQIQEFDDNDNDAINIYESEVDHPVRDWPQGAGTLNSLVYLITSDTEKDTKTQTFILTHQAFTTPWKFFKKLMERYDVPYGLLNNSSTIQLRVAITLKYWIENSFTDFDHELGEELLTFVKTRLVTDHFQVAKLLEKTINEKRIESAKEKMRLEYMSEFINTESSYPPLFEFFMQCDPQSIAQQLTLIDWQIYSQIEINGLLDTAWDSPKIKYKSTNIIEFIERVNQLAYWVATMIVVPVQIEQRLEVFKKVLKVADELRALNNFHSLAGITVGINVAAIVRLRQTKAALSKRALKSIEDWKTLFDPTASYKNYRTTVSKCCPPLIPYLGVYLSDLTFINEGNPTKLEGGLINFSKQELVQSILADVNMYKQSEFRITKSEPLYSYLLSLPALDEDQLFEVSLLREARQVAPNQN